jgi:hypothetical protein
VLGGQDALTQERIFVVFMATWLALGIGVGVFYWKADWHRKRKWHPRINVITGVLFLAFVWAMSWSPVVMLFMTPGVVLIQWLNWKYTRFCRACGATLFQNPPWARMNFCSKCGASLNDRAA